MIDIESIVVEDIYASLLCQVVRLYTDIQRENTFRNMHEFPGFYGNNAHAPTLVPRPFSPPPRNSLGTRLHSLLLLLDLIHFCVIQHEAKSKQVVNNVL